MATTGVVNGTSILVYLDGTAISYSTSGSLEITGAGTVDVSNKDSGYWAQKLAAHGTSWSVSCDGMFALDGAGINPREIHGFLQAGTSMVVKVATGDAADFFFTGTAVSTGFSLDAGDNAASTFSCGFEGLGKLSCTVT